MTRGWFVLFIFLARYSSLSLCFCQQFIRIVFSPRVAVACLLASKFMASSPCSASSYSLATTVLQISSSCLFLSLLLNPPFSFTWHSAEDGSDASDPRTITFLLVVLVQQLFTWLLCLVVARSRSTLGSTALWMSAPTWDPTITVPHGCSNSFMGSSSVLSDPSSVLLPFSYTCKEDFLHQSQMSFFAYPSKSNLLCLFLQQAKTF